jgi:hypothetical protein
MTTHLNSVRTIRFVLGLSAFIGAVGASHSASATTVRAFNASAGRPYNFSDSSCFQEDFGTIRNASCGLSSKRLWLVPFDFDVDVSQNGAVSTYVSAYTYSASFTVGQIDCYVYASSGGWFPGVNINSIQLWTSETRSATHNGLNPLNFDPIGVPAQGTGTLVCAMLQGGQLNKVTTKH